MISEIPEVATTLVPYLSALIICSSRDTTHNRQVLLFGQVIYTQDMMAPCSTRTLIMMVSAPASTRNEDLRPPSRAPLESRVTVARSLVSIPPTPPSAPRLFLSPPVKMKISYGSMFLTVDPRLLQLLPAATRLPREDGRSRWFLPPHKDRLLI